MKMPSVAVVVEICDEGRIAVSEAIECELDNLLPLVVGEVLARSGPEGYVGDGFRDVVARIELPNLADLLREPEGAHTVQIRRKKNSPVLGGKIIE